MINEVDETLRTMLRGEVLQGTDVEVELEAPTREWGARHSAPTIDMYLYDIREDLTKRAGGAIPQYDEEGRVVGHLPPPRTFRLAYLLTAWTQRPEDEHRLLAAVLGCLLEHDFVPEQHHTELLRDNNVVLMLQVGSPPPQDRQVSDVWTALGGNLKPSLDVVVSVKMDVGVLRAAGPPVIEPMVLRTRGFSSMEIEDDLRQSRHLAAVTPAASETAETAGSPEPEQAAEPAPTKTARRSTKKRAN